MCRDRDHGGRRCPNDGAVARRNRRQNAKKKLEFADEVITPTEPHFVEVEPVSGNETKELIASIRSDINEYKNLNIITPKVREIPNHHSTVLTEDEKIAERKIIAIGASIDELSLSYGAPADEEWEANVSERTAIEDSKIKTLDAQRDKMSELLGLEVENFGGRRSVQIGTANMSERNLHRTEYNRLTSMGLTAETSEFMRLHDNLEVISHEHTELLTANSDAYQELAKKRAAAYRKSLEEIGVEFANNDDIAFKQFKVTPGDNNKDIIGVAATHYPKAWVTRSNTELNNLELRSKAGRAGYSMGTIIVPPNANTDTMVHELAHRLEQANPEIGEAERRFINRRSGWESYNDGEIKKKPKIHTVYSGQSEWGYADNFADAYMGKVYDHQNKISPSMKEYYANRGANHYEIISMGMQIAFFGKHGGGFGAEGKKPDREHPRFILGLLATTAK